MSVKIWMQEHEKFSVFILYVILIACMYSQVVFFNKSLAAPLYYPPHIAVFENPGRIPVNSFNIDLGTPAFFEAPLNKYIGDMYKKGELPLWNPYQACGTPLAAQYSTRAYFPYQILEDMSPFWLWDFFMLGRILLAAFFTYLFLRLVGVSCIAGFLGGVCYGLSGSFTWFINLEEFTNVAFMMPAVFYFLERFLVCEKGRHLAECAIAIAYTLLAGQPEIAVYVFLLCALYYLFRAAILSKSAVSFLKRIAKLCAIFIIGICLSAFLILPFLELVQNAYHCHPSGGKMGVVDPAFLGIAKAILSPSHLELPIPYRLFPHNGMWDWLGGYTGITVLCVAMLGFFYKNRYRPFLVFFFLAGLCIVLKNFGSPLVSWIGRIPLLDQSWSPRWAGPVWTFSFAVSAALGIEAIREAPRLKRWTVFAVSFLIALLLMFFIRKTSFQIFTMDKIVIIPPLVNGLIVSVFAVFMPILLFLFHKTRGALVRGLVLSAIFELWFYIPKGMAAPWVTFKLVPFIIGIAAVLFIGRDRRRVALGLSVLAVAVCGYIDLRSERGFPERSDIFKEPAYVQFTKNISDYDRIAGADSVLMPNFASAFQLYDIRYINSLSVATYQYYTDHYLLKIPHTCKTDRLWFTGVPDTDPSRKEKRSFYREVKDNLVFYSYIGMRYILAPSIVSLPLRCIYDKEVRIYENPSFGPRAYIAYDVQKTSSYEEAQSALASTVSGKTRRALVEEDPPSWYAPPAYQVGEDLISITEYKSSRVCLAGNFPSSGLAVLTDTFYPGWQAFVDGKRSKIYRVNGLVRGVFVEKGEHSIVFSYNPVSFKLGLIIACVGVAACLVLAL